MRASAIACLLLLASCSASRSGEPPSLSVHSGDDEVEVTVGTYCAGEGCADGITTDGPLLRAAAGDSLNFEWDWAPADMAISLCKGYDFEGCDIVQTDDIGVKDEWRLEADPGKYRASAFITWQGGDASYDWKVLIED